MGLVIFDEEVSDCMGHISRKEADETWLLGELLCGLLCDKIAVETSPSLKLKKW